MASMNLFSSASLSAILVLLSPRLASARDAFVFLGATGDNALRPSGVWQGVYEAYTAGEFNKVGGLDIHVAMNTPHTELELHQKVNATLTPLHEELTKTSGWSCKVENCSVHSFLSNVTTNIWKGRDADSQAKAMAPSLEGYERITVYLSIPPFVFGSWSDAAIKNWDNKGEYRVHIAAEKPFGNDIPSSKKLHRDILKPGLPDANLHLVDHWLSFFINRHLLELRALILPRLKTSSGNAASWDSNTFSRVVVTEYEERGLEGRGEFFDGVGQVRDMVQSHLLQVMALSLIDTATPHEKLNEAKLGLFNKTSVTNCSLGQYKGFLLEPKLKFHANFADSTDCGIQLSVDTEAWKGVPITIQTGKDMGATIYTVDFYEKDGPGVLTFELGREEVGLGGIRVTNWNITDDSEFVAPAPGFSQNKTLKAVPAVNNGTGFFLNYSMPGLYFPQAYSMMAAALLTRDYHVAFVTYPQCERSWQIVTASSEAECLDPAPGKVEVYEPPSTCGNTPPAVCNTGKTVEYLYNVTFACNPEHNKEWSNISLYQAKCHISGGPEDLAYLIV
eukprot:CAMPEP_0206451462 /NCGR_PEP_ID=MMETSP0324_2-20121206/19355_1 /ASSEMBLY_ACC=CAM_ASM_000836 /TAXON_ID=2866 /ORGANISM="Crypthecodinium cohnii, Strain Seligo" /LENGTH=560 /DNA_ID=CAMNT_0053921347 /DNA_START=80 /DNA_END=1762 /DNA_ORIENTATION=-